MEKRSDRHRQAHKSFHNKIIIVTILTVAVMFGGVTTLAADGDISSILQDWFTKQETEGIADIDATIDQVQEEQTKRLKGTLQDMLDNQKVELTAAVEREKVKRVKELKAYADELIIEFETKHSKTMDMDTTEIDSIIKEAKQKMEATVGQEASKVTKEADSKK